MVLGPQAFGAFSVRFPENSLLKALIGFQEESDLGRVFYVLLGKLLGMVVTLLNQLGAQQGNFNFKSFDTSIRFNYR